MLWAQLGILVLMAMRLGMALANDGKEETTRTDALMTFITLLLLFGLYYCAGAFSKILG